MTKLVFGCGYLGLRVARRWSAAGHQVVALTRSEDRARMLEAEGLRAIVGDVSRPARLSPLPPAETVLYAVGYDRRGGASRRAVVVEGLDGVLHRLDDAARKLIYVSTTGVYGDHAGEWVDEHTTCTPTREAGIAALAAEQVLRRSRFWDRTTLLRLAGLYGPGRLPKVDDLRAGRTIAAPQGVPLNLIHVDDAVEVVLAAERSGRPAAVYPVSDGHPTDHRTFYRELARLLGASQPRFVEPRPDSRSSPQVLGNKRVSNQRMLTELKVELRYPSFRQGLRAIPLP